MAGNARFHNKYHRANHHTTPSGTIPDSGSDPIASPAYPFQGNFVINGALSASAGLIMQGLTGIDYSAVINSLTWTWKNGVLVSVV